MKSIGTALIIALMVCLSGCDRIESQVAGQPRTEVRRVDCSQLGYCFTCAPGFDMKMTCGPKLSNFCPGEREAEVIVTPLVTTFASGRQSHTEKTELVKYIGDKCE
jgi:hypothetical protein